MVTDTIIQLRTLLSAETITSAALADAFGTLNPHSYDTDIQVIAIDRPPVARLEVNLDPDTGHPDSVELILAADADLTLSALEACFGPYVERDIDDADEECVEFDIDVADTPFRTRLLVEYELSEDEPAREVFLSVLVMREERL